MILRFLLALVLITPLKVSAQTDVYFEVDTLNAGLTLAPYDLDMLTPQTAMSSFLSAIDAKDYKTAAHLLNLNDIPIASQLNQGADLAEKLGIVLDRKVVVNWQSLLERPDSLNTNLPGDDPMAGQARRSLLLGVLEVKNRPVAIRLNRIKPENGDAVWVFSRQTVDLIEPLYESYGPSKLEKLLPAWMRDFGPFGLFWWEIIGIPVMFFAAGFAAFSTWRGMSLLSDITDRATITKIIHNLRLPLTLLVLGSTVWLATNYIFIVSGIVSNLLEPLLVLVFVSAVMIAIVNVIDAFLDRIMVKNVEDLTSPEEENLRAFATTIFAIRRFTVAIAVIFGFGFTLTTANVFQTLGFSLLAGAGGLTLMVGFAAREVLGNILASLQISANRSARIGDQLVFESTLCTVERIHFSFVQLKVWDGTRLIVPVSEFVSKSFINRTLIDNDMIRSVTLKLAPHASVDAVRKFYEDWMDNDSRVGEPSTYECLVTGQGEFGIDIRLCAKVPDPRNGWDVECDLREAVINHLNTRDADILPHIGTQFSDQNDQSVAIDEKS